jgi:hypothetical protein
LTLTALLSLRKSEVKNISRILWVAIIIDTPLAGLPPFCSQNPERFTPLITFPSMEKNEIKTSAVILTVFYIIRLWTTTFTGSTSTPDFPCPI